MLVPPKRVARRRAGNYTRSPDVSSDRASANICKVPPGCSGAFLGKWALTLDGPQGVFEQSVVVKDEAKVLFDINGGQFSMSGTGVKK